MANLVRDPAIDRSLRSVFVGNIPYEATEEQLKDIFSEVGPVLSFRLVYDRETGKPKGYGFCEYQDQETALSAMRNLNGREFNGRALRVDNAASEKNKEELKNLGTAGPVMESPYGDAVSPEDAPESISRAVASLPPEQMFELMKQMKLCIQNSPQEARNMLLQNPQLAYALLQAQVVMRIVDPEIAMKMLHRPANVTPLISSSQPVAGPNPGPVLAVPAVSQPQPMVGMHVNGAPPMMQPQPMQTAVTGQGPGPVQGPGGPVSGPVGPGGAMQPPMGIPSAGPVPMDRGQGAMHSPVTPAGTAPIERGQVPMQDPRANLPRGPPGGAAAAPRGLLGDAPNDPRGGTLLSVTGEVEPRGYLGPPHQGPPMHLVPAHDGRGPPQDMRNALETRGLQHDLRAGPMGEQRGPIGEQRGPLGGPMGEPRGPMGEPRGPMGDPRGMMGDPRGPLVDQRGPPHEPRGSRDPRGIDTRGPGPGPAQGPAPNPRGPMAGALQGPGPHPMGNSGPQGPQQPVPPRPGPAHPVAGGQAGGFSPAQTQVTPQDHEKAALIMQVLQLTPEQIAMLPPEQRQSILILKEQIQKSAGAP
ncbi:cleavage stimulation factor subunit 2 isoform X2 [Callorhinchus milii]|nr:cleavage stimulation factor subunit 2 isoform X2 [Callorhinchus milii]